MTYFGCVHVTSYCDTKLDIFLFNPSPCVESRPSTSVDLKQYLVLTMCKPTTMCTQSYKTSYVSYYM